MRSTFWITKFAGRFAPGMQIISDLLNHFVFAIHIFLFSACIILHFLNKRMYKFSAYQITLKRRHTVIFWWQKRTLMKDLDFWKYQSFNVFVSIHPNLYPLGSGWFSHFDHISVLQATFPSCWLLSYCRFLCLTWRHLCGPGLSNIKKSWTDVFES